ncbi:MAG: GGDEF domain-containing protein [Pseudohongiellaceae bacterium]|nr:GGDEF domain-containing protein [Pseudohongiellaceae bacterium]
MVLRRALFWPYIFALLSCSASIGTYAADSVKLQLRWTHQFQFAGYYMALEKGFYDAAGLDVELIEGGPDALTPIEDVLAGNVDFAITGSGVVIERMAGKPVVAIAAIMQTSPIVWISLESSNIRTPHDLAGHRVLIMPPPESAELLIMLEREGLSADSVNIVPTSFDINDIVTGEADAYDGYISNEPYYLEQQGIDYSIINPKDYGINFYSDVLITSEHLANRNPDLVNRFKDASLQGWLYALNNIEETIELIHTKYAPEKTLEHLRFEANTISDLVMTDLVQIGHMNPGRWQFIAQSYRDLNMTSAPVDLNGFLFEPSSSPDYSLAIRVGGLSAALLALASLAILKFRRLSLQLKETNILLSQQTITDQLTQTRNRRGMVQEAETALKLASRNKLPCVFLMLDIDHFKAVNDEYGHQTGDAALIEFARTISAHRRESDIIARVGGEEFAILLIDSSIEDAKELAQQILQDVRDLKIQARNSDDYLSLTTSIGIAAASGSLETFWLNADKALYKAKESGRNTIVIHEP